eukprot:jgi/Galph1/5180/GphlegSOOS_G3815.1
MENVTGEETKTVSDLFTVTPFASDLPYRVSTLAAVDSYNIVIGTTEGYLLCLSLDSTETNHYKLTSSRKLSNKNSTAFAVGPSLSQLHCLTVDDVKLCLLLVDYCILAFELPSLEIFEVSGSPKQNILLEHSTGAHLFTSHSWDKSTAYVAVAVKKRIRLLALSKHNYRDGFVFCGEQDSADLPLAMRLGGSATQKELCVSTFRDHIIYQISDDGALQVRNVVSMRLENEVNTTKRTTPVVAANSSSSFYILRRMKGLMSSPSVREPIAVPLEDNKWLLELEQGNSFRIFSSSQGFVPNSVALSEYGIPNVIIPCRPFCIIYYPRNQLIIRTLSNKGIGSIVQTISLQNYVASSRFFSTTCMVVAGFGDLAHDGVAGYVFWSTKIFKLSLRESIQSLVKQMENENCLQLALEIAEALDTDFGRERVYSLRESLSLQALKNGNHSLALAYLSEMNIPTQQVIELREKYVPESWKSYLEEWAQFLWKHYRQEMEQVKREHHLSEDSRVDIRWLKGKDEIFYILLETLFMAHFGSKKLIELLDQVRCHLLERQAISLLELVKEPWNESEKKLFLFSFYDAVASYEKALSTLENLIEMDNEGRTDYLNRMEKYLKKLSLHLNSNSSNMILEHWEWYVVHGGPSENMLEILATSTIPLSSSLKFLQAHSCELLIKFLEQQLRRLEQGRRVQSLQYTELLNDLATAYIDNYLYAKEGETLKTSDSVSEAIQKLEDFINERRGFDPQKMLNQLPADAELYRERALLFGQQGKYLEALHLFIEEGLDADAAESFVQERVPSQEHTEVWTQLIKLYLAIAAECEDEKDSELAEEKRSYFVVRACEVLGRKEGVKIDTTRVIRELSNQIDLKRILPFLLSCLSATVGRLRASKVKKSLLKSEHLLLSEQLVQKKKQKIVIGRDRNCCICSRKIGVSAVAAYSDNSIAHLLCHRNRLQRYNTSRSRSHSNPKTGSVER